MRFRVLFVLVGLILCVMVNAVCSVDGVLAHGSISALSLMDVGGDVEVNAGLVGYNPVYEHKLVDYHVFTPENVFLRNVEDHLRVRQTQVVTADAKVLPTITSVEPNIIARYAPYSFTLTFKGDHISPDIQELSLMPYAFECGIFNSEGVFQGGSSNDHCRAIIISRQELQVHLEPILRHRVLQEYYDWDMTLNDKTVISLPKPSLIENVVPWDSTSWIGSIIYLSVVVIVFCVFVWGSDVFSYDTYRYNKKAPENSAVFIMMTLCIAISVILFILAFLIWSTMSGRESTSFVYLLVLALVGINIVLPPFYSWLSTTFHAIMPRIARFPIVVALVLVAVATPFLFQSQPNLVIGIQFGVLATSVGLGAGGLRVARNRLEEARKWISDDELQTLIEQKLYQQGAVKLADLGDLPRDRAMQAINRYYTTHQAKRSLTLQDHGTRLSFARGTAVAAVTGAFATLRQALSDPAVTKTAQSMIADQLAQLLQSQFDFQPGQPFQINPSDDIFRVYSLNPITLQSILPNPFPLIMLLSREVISEQQIERLQQIQHQARTRLQFSLIVPIDAGQATRARLRHAQGSIGRANVTLDETTWLNILTGTSDVREAFMREVGAQVDLIVYSPYNDTAPTPIDMFYGRRAEVAMIVEKVDDASIVVTGARRIGKTSIINEARRILLSRGKLLRYLDCYPIANYQTFFDEIANEWEVPLLSEPHEFPNLVRMIQEQHPEQMIVFQFDEIDQLLAFDVAQGHGETLFRTFRALAQDKRCQFIFSGERTILERLDNPKSAFYNFAIPIAPALLDRTIADRLVQEPMQLIGLHIEQTEAALALIYEKTAGHPNLIQFVCKRVVEAASQSGKRRISLAMIREQCESRTYLDRYLSTFLSQSTGIEAAMALCVLEQGRATESEILAWMEQSGVQLTAAQVLRGLRYLTLSHVLTPAPDGYTIKPPLLATSLSIFPLAYWKRDFLHRGNHVWRGSDE